MISKSVKIHPSSVIEDGAHIADDVEVGPFCHIGPKVTLGAGTSLASHVVIAGRTSIGENNRIFSGAVLGGEPQNINYHGEDTELIIGNGCTIREGVTMNTGMPDAGGKTTIGDKSLFLAYSHIAHDCHIGSNVILSNNVMLGGHVVVGDRVIMGGGAAAHQFCRIGHHAFIGGLAACSNDVIPFGMLNGNPGILGGLNVVGMARSGMPKAEIQLVRRAYKQLFRGEAPIHEMLAKIKPDFRGSPVLDDIFAFIEADSQRGLSSAAKAKRA